jgi:hypothetical protein
VSVNWPGRAVGADGDVVEFRNGATTLGAVERSLEIDEICASQNFVSEMARRYGGHR